MFKRFPVQLAIAAVCLLILPPILLALRPDDDLRDGSRGFRHRLHGARIFSSATPGWCRSVTARGSDLPPMRAALIQLKLMPGSFFGPAILGVLITIAVAIPFGYLILRRRGCTSRC